MFLRNICGIFGCAVFWGKTESLLAFFGGKGEKFKQKVQNFYFVVGWLLWK